jgi:hypothetical protein
MRPSLPLDSGRRRDHHMAMSEENPDKPDPIEDVRKGRGLLFRAAKSTLDQLPTRQFEDAVVSGAREVGRAIENVTDAIDKQIFKRGSVPPNAEAGAPVQPEGSSEPKAEPPKESDSAGGGDEPKGPRVG